MSREVCTVLNSLACLMPGIANLVLAAWPLLVVMSILGFTFWLVGKIQKKV
jgi:hypothetical protein